MPRINDKGSKDLTAQLEAQNQRLEDCLLKERQERASVEESVEAVRRSEDLHRLIFENVRDFAIFFARKAAERIGGQIGVESKPGQGSRFWLQRPKADK